MASPIPNPTIANADSYRVPKPLGPIDLWLNGNEGPALDPALLNRVPTAGDALRRYPDTRALRALLAKRLNIRPQQLLITAGADDGLDRACRALLWRGRSLILPRPTFEMLERYAARCEATIVGIDWPGGAYPTDDVLAAVDADTAAIAVVSPNNPTGAVADGDDLQRLSAAAPQAVILLDHAYVELADDDLTELALTLPNVVVFRTLSKAWGLAGLRIGYAAGPPPLLEWLRRSGNPYPVASASLTIAEAIVQDDAPMRAYVGRVRKQRPALIRSVRNAGLQTTDSQGNFVFARGRRSRWLREALAAQGIAIRAWDEDPHLAGAVRISCAGDAPSHRRLLAAIDCACDPQALLFDMDGVLADVRRSYHEAIRLTAERFGVALSTEEISHAKSGANVNNDWRLTQQLLAERGVSASLDDVTAVFEELYQGSDNTPGFAARETLLIPAEQLRQWSQQRPLGIVTGRPRADALRFLRQWQIEDLFAVLVCMRDAPEKPDPAPVNLALEQLGCQRAWMLGDTPDDIAAARGAGVVGIGFAAGEDVAAAESALLRAGAARVLQGAADLEDLVQEVLA